MIPFTRVALATAIVLLSTAAFADDLTGSDRFICSVDSVSACCDDGECASGTAAELNLPQFIEIDLAAKRVNTTKASGMNRTTPIENLKRVHGQIFMQGVENDRAFSFVLDEKTGEITGTVAQTMCSIKAFGKCTPLVALE